MSDLHDDYPVTMTFPRVAVVVPIFRHSALLPEAIESVLNQDAGFSIHAILVNDGCTFAETEDVCRDYAAAYPDRMTYLRKENGGLSDARNHGIRYVLANLPSVEAIYLLDADNRLRRPALARAMAELDACPEVDWIYPNIDMFGLEAGWNYGGPYSLLLHTESNLCEAGSLVRRRVFERGILFDTAFKLGWEDWDFFLSAARADFRGRNLEHFGFCYRKRPESMLADSERDSSEIAGAMRRKHKALMRPRALIALEQKECPRYAILLSDRGKVLYTVDPLHPEARDVTLDAFESDHWLSVVAPGQVHVPPFLIVMSADMLGRLTAAGMIHWVLWKLERDLARCSIAAMTLGPGQPGRMSVAEWLPSDGRHQEAIALAIDAKLLHEVMLDGSSTWIDTVVRPKSDPVIGVTELSLPIGPGRAEQPSRPTAVFDFLSIVHRLRASPFRDAASRRLDWREEAIPWRPRSHEIVRNALMGAPAYPWVRGGARRVGFILPLLEFGGVEKVALNIARGLRAHGWEPHLFLVEAQSAAITPEWSTAFASIGFLADAEFRAWGGGENDYLGTNIPGWAAAGQHQAALGMLYWLDAVISFHAAAVAGLMGKLRRLGVRTAISLHLSDRTAYGRPVGNTYLGLAFEHAYDLFLPCSHQLADWCNAMGVPRDKIVPVQNAPGFDLPPAQVDAAYMDRVARQPGEPLRVLYLGRLDRQKGIERLADVMRESDARRLNLAWRVIGKAVIDDGQAAVAPEIAAVLEPPLLTPAELARAYNWADVMVLLSHYEGLPLTILEAMRAGTVVLATDVGAVREVLRHRENGFVLAPARAASDCVDALAALAADRDLLRQLSARAYEGRRGYDWVEATRELVAKL